ncbi:hypothetical protein [Parapedobacter lycopersici]|uniref:hypothetical protein n=1 Tax=Parapedobacter lycopersici TaxID=1864939 RepID=UPI00214D7359|nr:hypothetical protein [Parapedobacter lycopersici]
MNKTIQLRTNPKDWGRIKDRIKRPHEARQLTLDLPVCPLTLHNLDDTTRFMVHRYSLDPDFMSVRTSEVIAVHNLVIVGGKVLKVVRVDPVSPGCVEIKTLKFGRYQK